QFLESILSASKKEMDRQEIGVSARKVQDIMRDVKFEKAYESLPLYCLSLMEAPRKQQLQLGKIVKNLHAQPMENLEKTTLLGIALIKIVGEQLLRQAVEDLGDRIKDTPSRSPLPVRSRKSP
ncbi:MAG TPA: hypothetical protein VJ761_03315, partial [Ktedonobacteraceae bacterium]|nr:hypothetical protein [Ktedonobacteraceae bacterium]